MIAPGYHEQMTQDARKSRLAEFMEAVWNKGDAAAVGAYVAPAYTIRHDPGDPWDGQTLDHAGYIERLKISRAPFPDQRFDIQLVVAGEGEVVITWLWQATHQGDLPGFPASGRTIRMSGATVYSFDEQDRIAGHWQITDRLGVYQQLTASRA